MVLWMAADIPRAPPPDEAREGHETLEELLELPQFEHMRALLSSKEVLQGLSRRVRARIP